MWGERQTSRRVSVRWLVLPSCSGPHSASPPAGSVSLVQPGPLPTASVCLLPICTAPAHTRHAVRRKHSPGDSATSCGPPGDMLGDKRRQQTDLGQPRMEQHIPPPEDRVPDTYCGDHSANHSSSFRLCVLCQSADLCVTL